jgi:hypothetical protein
MRFASAVAALIILSGSQALAGRQQSPPGPYVSVLDEKGVLRVSFTPNANPIADVLTAQPRTAVALPRKDVRLADGQIVTGFGFDGWHEGSSVRVVVSALVPADGSNRFVEVPRGVRPIFKKLEFASFTVAVGETRAVEEMNAMGIEPMIVRVDATRPEFKK